MTKFREAVLERVKEIPSGRVVTYGDLGDRKRANVGGAMAYLVDNEDAEIPWHRVVKQDGRLSDRAMSGQRNRLRAEGITFDADGRVDLDRFQWKEHQWGRID
ncbi:MAG: MGMT family protein [Deltaproteobacteria bacterium]|nr:MGMT family protein [Deltaproteobacteria bacterium]